MYITKRKLDKLLLSVNSRIETAASMYDSMLAETDYELAKLSDQRDKLEYKRDLLRLVHALNSDKFRVNLDCSLRKTRSGGYVFDGVHSDVVLKRIHLYNDFTNRTKFQHELSKLIIKYLL